MEEDPLLLHGKLLSCINAHWSHQLNTRYLVFHEGNNQTIPFPSDFHYMISVVPVSRKQCEHVFTQTPHTEAQIQIDGASLIDPHCPYKLGVPQPREY